MRDYGKLAPDGMSAMRRPGFPITRLLAGTDAVTTEPADTIELSPIVTPGKMIALFPIQTLLPMTMGFTL